MPRNGTQPQDAIVHVFTEMGLRSDSSHTLVIMWVVNLSFTGYTTAGHTPQPLDGSLFLCLDGREGIFCVLGQFLLHNASFGEAVDSLSQSSHITCVSRQLCLSKMSYVFVLKNKEGSMSIF